MSRDRQFPSFWRNMLGRALPKLPLRRRLVVPADQYQAWMELREKPAFNRERMTQTAPGFAYKPKISIIMPVFNTRRDHLDKAIISVRQQIYDQWELCICNDGSTDPGVQLALKEWTGRDSRIKAVSAPVNEGISAASNRALTMATGEFVGLLDHDDELSADALFEVAQLLQTCDADMIYSDEDKLQPDGTRCDPFFKPDWSPEYLLSCMYTCHFGVYRKSLVDEIGGLRRGFEGSQDYDLVLRLSERSSKIFHIPKILYHWRKTAGSTAEFAGFKSYAREAGRRALEEHLVRRQIKAQVRKGAGPNRYRVRPEIACQGLVSVIIAGRDNAALLARCLQSIEAKTDHRNYELLVVDDGSTSAESKALIAALRHQVLPFAGPFNLSSIINFAARHARGSYLMLLSNQTEVISHEWLTAMLECCQLPGAGVVGAKLLYANRTIQHAGIVLGIGGVAGHSHRQAPARSRGYFDSLVCIRNYSAVTAACMMVRREVFEQSGGFDEQLPVAFNDLDFCLRVRERGLRTVWTPYAELIHHEPSPVESVDRGEREIIRRRWGNVLRNDPYYNPNLTLMSEDYGLRLQEPPWLMGLEGNGNQAESLPGQQAVDAL